MGGTVWATVSDGCQARSSSVASVFTVCRYAHAGKNSMIPIQLRWELKRNGAMVANRYFSLNNKSGREMMMDVSTKWIEADRSHWHRGAAPSPAD